MLVAAYVRLSHPDLSWFGIDQARDARTALGIVSGRAFPVLGVEVAGGPAHTWGPAYYYLIALPFAVSRDPSVAVAFLSATTVAALLVTYRLGRAFFGPAVALLSAALVATYPLSVIDAKGLWNLAPVPLFAAVFFYALLSAVIHGRSAMIIVALGALGILLQLHLSALSLGALLATSLVLFRPRPRAIHLALGMGVLLTLLLPYLVGQSLDGFADLRAAASSSTELRPRGVGEIAGLVLGVVTASPDVVAGMPALHATCCPGLLLVLHRLEAWLLVLGLGFVVVAALRPGRHDGSFRAVVLIALGFAIPLLMLLATRAETKPHYFDVAYPMPFVAAALVLSRGVDAVGRIAGPRVRHALYAGVASLVALTVVLQVGFHRQVWRTIRTSGAAIWTPSGLEVMPIRYKAELARILARDFGVRSTDVFSRLHGSRARDWLEDGGYFFDQASRSAPPQGAPMPGPSVHYAVVRDEAGGTPVRGRRAARASTYTMVEYEPLIDYATWRCAVGSPSPTSEWTPVRLPAEASDLGGDPSLACRGAVAGHSSNGERLRIVVSLRGRAPGDHAVAALLVNGVPVAAEWTLAHSTFVSHSVDAVFDVSGHLGQAANELLVRIRSSAPRLGFDVYELRG